MTPPDEGRSTGRVEPERDHATTALSAPTASRLEIGILIAILVLALALRLWALGEVPPGLHVDEGHNGVDALRIARGWRPIFLPGNDGREALYSYLQAPLVAWLGPTAFALRLASALLGVAGVWAAWLWVRRLPLNPTQATAFAPIAALATAFATATTYWHLHFSRIAIRGILLPFIATLAAWALWRALRGAPRGRIRWAWALTGALYALALYAHPAGRLLALVPLPPLLWLALRTIRSGDRTGWTSLLRGALTAALAAAVVLLPLGLWAMRHPEIFFAHSVSVSVLDPAVHEGEPLRRIAVNAWRTVRALAWRGSGSWYHNLRDRPVLDPLGALLWATGALGLLRAAWIAGRDRGRGNVHTPRSLPEPDLAAARPLVGDHDPVLVLVFLAGWVGVMALPTVLTSGAPNFSRAVGVLPALLLPVGLAIAGAEARLRRRGVGQARRLLLLVLLLAPSALLTGYDHFLYYARAWNPHEVFGSITSDKATALREMALEPGTIVLPSTIVEQRAVLRFLTDGAGPDLLPVPRPADIYVPANGQAVYAFDVGEEQEEAMAYLGRWPEVTGAKVSPETSDILAPFLFLHAEGTILNEQGGSLWRLLDAPPPPTGRAPGLPAAVFGDSLALVAVERREGGPAMTPPFVAEPGGTLQLVLWWQVLRTPGRDWTRLTHLIDGEGEGHGQQDGAPFGGHMPMSRWQPGDHVATLVPLTVAESAPVGASLSLRVGWYDPTTGERLPLPGDDDAAAEVAVVEIR